MQSSSVISVNAVSKTYLQGSAKIDILRGLNVDVAPGETVAIVGHSGSGKSTLLALLAGLARPTGGDIVLAGQSLAALSEEGLTRFRAAHMGIIFQQFHLMSGLTALENVGLPLEIRGDKDFHLKAEVALAQVGLKERAAHFPSQLSGGECQRVAIARAIVTQPSLLLADEPSGNLDDATGDAVMNLLFDLVRDNNMTMILVTHNKPLAQRCHRVLRLEHGLLVPEPQGVR